MPEIKTYQQKAAELIQAWNSYATVQRDRAAEAMVNADVRAYMKDTGQTDYRTAMRERREQVRQLEYSLSPAAKRYEQENMGDPGFELDRIATKNLEINPSLGRRGAFKLAMLENPTLATHYMNCEVDGTRVAEVQQYWAEQATLTKRYDRTSYGIIGNIVSGMPKLPDGSFDIPNILAAINAFGGTTLQEAAQEELERQTRAEVAITGQPGSEMQKPGAMAEIKRRVANKRKGLAAVANGSPASEMALREMYWQLLGHK